MDSEVPKDNILKQIKEKINIINKDKYKMLEYVCQINFSEIKKY